MELNYNKSTSEKIGNSNVHRNLGAFLQSSLGASLEKPFAFAESDNINDIVYSKADLHIHSNQSNGIDSPEDIVDAAIGKLQVIAITDHNSIKGALRAKEYALKNKIKVDVIIGEEISTKNGHIVGLFLNNEIMPGKDARDAIYEIHKQGGIAVAAHPFSFISSHEEGYKPVKELLHELAFDAIEVVSNSYVFSIASNIRAYLANASLDLAELGVSNAHKKEFIGKGYTGFAGISAKEFRIQLTYKDTVAHFNPYSISETVSNAVDKLKSVYFHIFNKNQNK